jgi:hypothetical protein
MHSIENVKAVPTTECCKQISIVHIILDDPFRPCDHPVIRFHQGWRFVLKLDH